MEQTNEQTPQSPPAEGGFNVVLDSKVELDKLFAERNAPKQDSAAPPAQAAPTAPVASPTPTEPAKPTEPPKPATPDFSKLDAADWKPKNSDDWKKVRARMAALEAEKSAVEERLKAAIVGDEAERIRKENEDYKKFVREFAAEKDPQLNAAFKAQMDAAVSTAIRAVPEPKRKALEKALRNLDPETAAPEDFATFFEDIGPAHQAFLLQGIQNADAAIRDRRSKVAEATANFDKQQQTLITQQQQAAAKRRKEFEAAFDERLKVWQDPVNGHPVLKFIPGDDEHNRIAQEVASSAKALLFDDTADPGELVNGALWAYSAPGLLEAYNQIVAKNSELEAALAKLRGASPSLSGAVSGDAEAGDEVKSAVDAGQSPGAILAAGMRKQGLIR